jgi:hypothetical protein
MADDAPHPPRDRSWLWKAAEVLHVIGILALFMGMPIALTLPMVHYDWANISRRVATGLCLPVI